MIYETYFELPINGFWDWALAIPLGLLIFGIIFFSYRKKFSKVNQKYATFDGGKTFMYLWFGLIIFLTLISYFSVYSEYFKARKSLLSGTYSVAEGVISEYSAGTNQKGSAYDTFCVKDACFEVSDWEVTSGFHQMRINGSPLKNDLHVRISYVGERIVRLELERED